MDCTLTNKVQGSSKKQEPETQSRRRRNRTVFNPESIKRMEGVFDTNRYPDIRERESLATELSIPEPRIQVWFQNRRSRTKAPNINVGSRVSPKIREDITLDDSRKDQPVTNMVDKDDKTSKPTTSPEQKVHSPSSPVLCSTGRIEAAQNHFFLNSVDMVNNYVNSVLSPNWLSHPYHVTSWQGWIPIMFSSGYQQHLFPNAMTVDEMSGNNGEISPTSENREKTSSYSSITNSFKSEDECIVDRLFRFSKNRQCTTDKKRRREESAPYTMKVPRIKRTGCSAAGFERSEDRSSDDFSSGSLMYGHNALGIGASFIV